MVELRNDRFLRALRREPVDVTPVWMMRQAGRYLPEYRATREEAGSFMDLCKNPELACEVTLQPIRRYSFDAAIIFSDILTIPDAMGLGLSFAKGEGPQFDKPVRNARDVAAIGLPDMDRDLGYVMEAIRTTRAALDGRVPLIGFAGSPWTLATYMVEGRSKTDFSRVKGLLFDEPAVAHRLLDILARAVADYLRAQIGAGAQALMLFDTWGGILTGRDYREFSLDYMRRISEVLDRDGPDGRVPLIFFTKGGGLWLEDIAESGCDAVGLDWTVDIADARTRIGDKVALQGNMDPSILSASPERIRREVETILEGYGAGAGHVFNLGHGIQPHVDPAGVEAFVQAVHELSKRYH